MSQLYMTKLSILRPTITLYKRVSEVHNINKVPTCKHGSSMGIRSKATGKRPVLIIFHAL